MWLANKYHISNLRVYAFANEHFVYECLNETFEETDN